MKKVEVYEQELPNGGFLAIIKVQGVPASSMDEIINGYLAFKKLTHSLYSQYKSSHSEYVRILVFGINDLKYEDVTKSIVG